jgi:hypothetical protein
MNRIAILCTFALLAALAGCGGGGTSTTGDDLRLVSANQSVIVSPLTPNGWVLTGSGGSTATHESGPATPPLGDDSLQLKVDATGSTAAQARNTTYQGTQLADVTELSYHTFITFNQSGQAPYIILQIDNTGDGLTDDLLFFEPLYSDGTYNGSFNQGPVQTGVWQDWDAFNGGWYSVFGESGSGPGAGVISLAQYIADHPSATIVNSTNGAGGVRFVTGFGGPADWGNFEGNIDAVKIGVNGDTKTFNFELTTKDDCKNGGWQEMGFKNQGQCVSAHVKN